VCALTLGLSACTGAIGSSGEPTVDTLGAASSNIESAVTEAMKLSGSTEAVVGVWKGEDAAYVQGFGDGVDGNTHIRAAQASQPVMCAALLSLVDEGKLSLDRKVSADLPRQVGVDDITYAQLCDGTSGLADFKPGITDIFANNPTRAWPDKELLAQGLARSPLSWPGLDVHLSDTSAVLLGRALHQAANEDLPDLLKQHVFAKAGMGASYYPEDPLTDTSLTSGLTGLTQPFAAGEPVCDVDPTAVSEVSPSMLAGAGATVTTVNDLKNLYTHYFDGTFGADSTKLVTEAKSTLNPKRDEDGKPVEDADEPSDEAKAAERFWAFGLEKVDSLYGQSGAMTGTLTAAYHDPKTDFTVVVALNNSTAGAGFIRTLALQLAAIAGEETSVSAEDHAAALAETAPCRSDESEAEEE